MLLNVSYHVPGLSFHFSPPLPPQKNHPFGGRPMGPSYILGSPQVPHKNVTYI